MKKITKLINPKSPIEQYSFKNFICTVIFPIACISILHLILYQLAGLIEIAILKRDPSFQFNVWIPFDNHVYSENAKAFFWVIYYTHSIGELFLPIMVAIVCGRKSFATYIKCATISYAIGFILLVCFPIVDYLHYDWYSGPDSLPYRPSDFEYSTSNLQSLPSFHCLVALCPLAAMCFVKIDQKKVNKALYIGFLIFMIIYYILIYFSTLVTKQHFAVDGLASIVVVAVVFGLSAIIHRQRNGIWVANAFEKVYLFVNSNNQKYKGWRITVMILILVVILFSTIFRAILDGTIAGLMHN